MVAAREPKYPQRELGTWPLVPVVRVTVAMGCSLSGFHSSDSMISQNLGRAGNASNEDCITT